MHCFTWHTLYYWQLKLCHQLHQWHWLIIRISSYFALWPRTGIRVLLARFFVIYIQNITIILLFFLLYGADWIIKSDPFMIYIYKYIFFYHSSPRDGKQRDSLSTPSSSIDSSPLVNRTSFANCLWLTSYHRTNHFCSYSLRVTDWLTLEFSSFYNCLSVVRQELREWMCRVAGEWCKRKRKKRCRFCVFWVAASLIEGVTLHHTTLDW